MSRRCRMQPFRKRTVCRGGSCRPARLPEPFPSDPATAFESTLAISARLKQAFREPVVLFEFELDEFKTRGSSVPDRARLARVLPDEVAIIGRHAAVGVPRNDFGEHAPMDINSQAWSRLRDLPRRLPWVQDHAPG